MPSPAPAAMASCCASTLVLRTPTAPEPAISSRNRDRKSTRLNSSHVKISYAVFCLTRPQPGSTLLPYTTLFRSHPEGTDEADLGRHDQTQARVLIGGERRQDAQPGAGGDGLLLRQHTGTAHPDRAGAGDLVEKH